MTATDELLGAFELHDADRIRAAIAAGADPVAHIRGKAPVLWLIEMYTRSSRFTDCLKVMLDSGATLNDPLLESILLDEGDRLREILNASPRDVERVFSLACAYTSLQQVSALHVCAEYNRTHCARVLLDAGADVDVRAGIDANGFGAQSPLFHTVNSNRNYCRPMMELLVEAGADLDIHLSGLVWGCGFDWETVVFDVTPISYAQCGLYPQFHRREQDVYSNVDYLYVRRYGNKPVVRNVPNKYVDKDFDLGAARAGQKPTWGLP